MPDTFANAKPSIEAALAAARKSVYSPTELLTFLRGNWKAWDLPKQAKMGELLAHLLSEAQLREVVLRSTSYASERRYIWGSASPYEIALSLRRGAYLSHGSAVFLHGLTDRIPKTIYLNREQSPKPSAQGTLTQERIALAFSRPQRTSNYDFAFERRRILLVSGKNTNRLEVGTLKGPEGESLTVTKLERTLIDIAVRPAYSGGVYQVLEAFRAAKDRASIAVLLATLKRIDYVYPYNQAIGFLMERAEYDERLCTRLLSLGANYDFYLVHGMKKTQYDPKWRLFYPEGL
jgi:hypothetical protein